MESHPLERQKINHLSDAKKVLLVPFSAKYAVLNDRSKSNFDVSDTF